MSLKHYELNQPFSMIRARFLATCAKELLPVVSGAAPKTALPHLLDAPPSIESTVFPAPVPSLIVLESARQEQS